MKHATNQVDAETLEAAYCLHFDEFFPDTLLNMALKLPQNEWVIALICNRLADKREKEREN